MPYYNTHLTDLAAAYYSSELHMHSLIEVNKTFPLRTTLSYQKQKFNSTTCCIRSCIKTYALRKLNNNNHVDIYSAVIMTEVIRRVHWVHLVNAEQCQAT